jgi:hypothetical protein
MTKAKGYQELVGSQSKLAQDYGQELLKSYRDAVEVLTEARDAVAEVMDQQMQAASKNLQAAGETIKKATVKAAAPFCVGDGGHYTSRPSTCGLCAISPRGCW